MNLRLLIGSVAFLSFAAGSSVQAQSSNTDYKGWHLKDRKADTYYGISLNQAYEQLKGRKSTPVIVGVIDSGIDTAHEDLKPVLWTNSKEIPGNGIDDDKNGYVDDYYGWNFLGNKDGRNINKENMERARVYHRFKNKYDGKIINEDSLSATEREEYKEWKRSASEISGNPEDQVELMFVEVILKNLKKQDSIIRDDMKRQEYTLDELEAFEPKSDAAKKARHGFLESKKVLNVEGTEKNTSIISQLDEYVDGKRRSLNAKDNPLHDYRAEIIKDNYFDFNDRYYGNPDVMGPDATHGTHVSGIIGAVRNNGIGMDGVADNVKLMMVRAVPDGDEYDKDIALAIRYAVDHGAKVINMSFGKGYSPEKHWVDEAVKYAEKHDVLLIHAAGNDASNIDEKASYPSPQLRAYENKPAPNFMTVGAIGDPSFQGGRILAPFSNYGKENVDVFAPGVKIYATMPGGNKYAFLQGTSMAAPVVAGVAALIRSYFPQLTAVQVREAIEKTATQVTDAAVKVSIPGSNKEATLQDLSRTGGLLNAAAAIEYAAKLAGDKSTVTPAASGNTEKKDKKKKAVKQ